MALQPRHGVTEAVGELSLLGALPSSLIGNATTDHPDAGKGNSAREGPERLYACLPPFHGLSHRTVRDCRSRMVNSAPTKLSLRPSVTSTPLISSLTQRPAGPLSEPQQDLLFRQFRFRQAFAEPGISPPPHVLRFRRKPFVCGLPTEP